MIRFQRLNRFGLEQTVRASVTFLVVGAIGVALLATSHAQSSRWTGMLEAFNDNSGYCLTASGSSTGSPVVLNRCHAKDSGQIWTVNDLSVQNILGGTNVQLVDIESGIGANECLNNWQGSTATGARIKLSTCGSSPANEWAWGIRFTSYGFSAHQIANVASAGTSTAGLCLEDANGSRTPGTNVQLEICKTSSQGPVNQEWYEDTAPAS
jgi:Ricin-type beta-trefoil lectin domain